MKRLALPEHDYATTIDLCILGIHGNTGLLTRFRNSRDELDTIAVDYSDKASRGELYQITATSSSDAEIANELSRADFSKLYEYYFRDKRKPARQVYEKIMSAALEKCPYCGDIGTPKNLDHYLPRTSFPQFSILPINLIPSCRDCNMDEKGAEYSQSANEQIIHPYMDKDHFFSDQWISARFNDSPDGITEFEFFVDAPLGWCDTDKEIVASHFKKFNIAERYSLISGSHFVELKAQLDHWEQTVPLPVSDFPEAILLPIIKNAPFRNQWKRVMYRTLIDCSWPQV